MKQVIDGILYDTDKSKELGHDSYSNPGDFHYWRETLYKSPTGLYFLEGEGGGMTKYRIACGNNSFSGSSRITALTKDEAFEWTQEHDLVEVCEAEFADMLQEA